MNPTLPFVLREVDGVDFLAFQSVRPVLLMFAMKTSLERIPNAQMLFLQRIRIKGPTLKHVFCVYSVAFDSVIPCLWLAFEKNEGGYPCTTLQYKTRQYHKDPATWILPLKFASSFGDALLRSCDGAMAVKCVYWNKVHQIVARISDEKLRKSLANQLIGLATTEISEIKSAVKKLKKQTRETDPDVVYTLCDVSLGDSVFKHNIVVARQQLLSY